MTRAEAGSDVVLGVMVLVGAMIATSILAVALAPAVSPPAVVFAFVQGALVLAGVAWLLSVRESRWRELRLVTIAPADLWRGLLALALMMAVAYALSIAVEWLVPGAMEAHAEGLRHLADVIVGDLPFMAVVAGMMFVGFYEEVLVRGLLLERCRQVFGGIWVPVLVSSAIFGAAHFDQGWTGMGQTALIGVVLARLTLYWGTLWPAILAHAALNTLTLTVVRLAEDVPL
jgi:uncharacterized protein